MKLAAYFLWQQRGCPVGSPEADWFQAEAQIAAHGETGMEKATVVAMAEAVGSALGTVAGLAGSVAGLAASTHQPER